MWVPENGDCPRRREAAKEKREKKLAVGRERSLFADDCQLTAENF
jgi:hypothetical protein